VRAACIVIVALILTCMASAQFPDETPADTVRADSLPGWADSAVVFPDSTAPEGLLHDWLYPAGMLLITSLGFIMLFTTRSR